MNQQIIRVLPTENVNYIGIPVHGREKTKKPPHRSAPEAYSELFLLQGTSYLSARLCRVLVAGVGHDPTNLAGLVYDANSTADHFTAEIYCR